MKERLSNWLTKTEEQYNRLMEKPWLKPLRITTGVLWNLAILLAIFLVAGGVFAASVGAGYFASLVDDEKLRTKEEMVNQVYSYTETSEVFFADGESIGKLRTDLKREEISLEEVSDHAIQAVLSTEDEYFNVHDGIVPKAVLRGLLQDITNADSQTGGSTLTQQLIKNQILTNEVSYERKAKEILLAMRLEKFMDKDEILEAYLNVIPYGRDASGANIAGIETAAQGLFGVSASELSLPQAAYIAGIPQAPFLYTPFTNEGQKKAEEALEPGIDRMKTVLFRMHESGVITDEEYEAALAYDITGDLIKPLSRAWEKTPFLTEELERRAVPILMNKLAEENGIDPAEFQADASLYEEYWILADREMRTKGYQIHSTIDKDLYEMMEDFKDNYDPSWYGQNKKDPVTGKVLPVEVGSTIIENKTGRILSFIGGRNHGDQAYNHATQAYRSIGSTVKPLLVYGPAIEKGLIGAGSPVVDVKFSLEIPGQTTYQPSNFISTSEQGIMPARLALAQSQNLPALRLFDQFRDEQPFEYMEQAGFKRISADKNVVPSSPLGGGVEGTVEEVTNAYAMIANGGQFIEGYMIEKIEDADGDVIYEHETEPEQVFSPQTAYILTDMLRDTFNEQTGTANRAKRALNFSADFAGKTGTTQDAKDSWLTAYNPNVTMTVWLGYDSERLNFHGDTPQPSTRINRLWAQLMNEVNSVIPEVVNAPETFQAPEGVVTRSFCGFSGLAPGGGCTGAMVESDLFNANVMVPTKPDDSLVSGSYTTVNGKRYMALSSTPSEFVIKGRSGVSEAFVDRMLGRLGGDAGKLFPKNSAFSSIVSGDELEDDGSSPSSVSASLSGQSIQWNNSSSNDVVGYRIYRSGSSSRVASISESEDNSYRLPGPGTYVVVAVDIAGRQSSPSNTVEIDAPEPEPEPASSEEPAETEEQPDSPPPSDTDTDDSSESDTDEENSGNEDEDSSGDETGDSDSGSTPPPEDEEDNGSEEDNAAPEEEAAA